MNADMKWLDNPEVFRVNQLDAHSDHCYYTDYEELEKKAKLGQQAVVCGKNGKPKVVSAKYLVRKMRSRKTGI